MKMFFHNLKQLGSLLRNWWKLNSIIAWYGRNCSLSSKKIMLLEQRIMQLENRKIDKEYVMELLCSQDFIKAQEEYEAEIKGNLLD